MKVRNPQEVSSKQVVAVGVAALVVLVATIFMTTEGRADATSAKSTSTTTRTTSTLTVDRFSRPPRHVIVTPITVTKPTVKQHPKATPKKPVVKHAVKKKTVHHYVSPHIVGILPSAYKGSWYDARFEQYRMCVVKRESMGHYDAINSQGYSGAYQFGLSWTRTIQKWTGEHVPIRYMSRYAQDLAFWRAFNHGKGAGNWAGGRWYCGF